MTLRILDIDQLLAGQEWALGLGKSTDAAFPKLGARDFFEPARCIKHLINWIWLNIQKGSSSERISTVASEVMRRSLEVYGRTIGQRHRGEHDLFLLSAAIIVGERELTERVVGSVRCANESCPQVYYSSCCGMLKARITGDKLLEQTQLELHLRCKGSAPVYRVASGATYTSFCEEDNKSLVRQCHGVCEKFWTMLKEASPEPFCRNGDVELGTWPTNAFWPWSELTLLKLACPDAEMAPTDDVWIPRRFLREGTP